MARGEAYFGEGSGPVWLNKVNCNGDERHLGLCGHAKMEAIGHCQHLEDAGVTCNVDQIGQFKSHSS